MLFEIFQRFCGFYAICRQFLFNIILNSLGYILCGELFELF